MPESIKPAGLTAATAGAAGVTVAGAAGVTVAVAAPAALPGTPLPGEKTQLAGKPPVADRFAIQDLIARYGWALDTGDVESFVGCFTPGAVVIEEVFEDPDRWEGHAGVRALIEHYRASPGFPGRQHHVTQSLLNGDGARCSVKSFAFVTECRGEPPYTLRFCGYYDDKLVKLDGEWLFQERVIRLWDGPVLANFPGRGSYVPRKRPPELVIKRKP